MRIKIEVTASHIRRGKRGKCFECPISLAIRSKLRGWSVGVGEEVIELQDKNRCWKFCESPRSVQRFIQKFDFKKPVKPFNFILNIENDY